MQDKNFAWEQGQFGFQNGAPVDTDARIRTAYPITQRDAMEVVCGAEYNFFVFAWEDGTYVGCLKADDTFSKGNTNIIAKTSFVLANYPDYDYKFVLKKTSGDATSPSDGVNCVYHGFKIVALQNEISTIDERISNIQISKDLTIVNMGDSIFGNFRSPTDISTFLEGITGAKCYNVAFGGTRAVARPTTSPTADRRPFDLTVLAHSICTGDFTEQDAVIESIGGIYTEHLDALKQIDFSTVDILTLSYGTNDYANNQFVGDVSSGVITYAGALNSAANELLQAFPNLRIVFCTPIFRMMESGSDIVSSDIYQNDNGNTLIDFVAAAENVAKNIHSFAVNNYYMGVNAENYSQYYTDYTHPNEKMRKLIAANLAYNLFGGHEGANIDALKTSINDIQTDVYTFIGNKRIDTWIDGAYIVTNTSVIDTTPVLSAQWRYAIIPCAVNDIFTVTITGGSTPRAYCFIDANYNVLYKHTGSAHLENLVITAPATSAYLILNDTYRAGECYYGKYIKTDIIDRIKAVTERGDICPQRTTAQTNNGITITPLESGGYHISGTATGHIYYNFLVDADSPTTQIYSGFKAGASYYLDFESPSKNVTVRVMKYVNSSPTTFIEIDHSAYFTIPSDAEGLNIGLHISSAAANINFDVVPRIYDIETISFASFVKRKNTTPMLSIIYDDGFKEFDTYIMPIIRQKKVPIATAVISESVGEYSYLMTWSEIQACYADGAEILPHFGAYTYEEWETFGSQDVSWRYYKTLNAIRAHGIYTPPVLVFSGSSSQRTICRMGAMRIFKAGFNAAGGNINQYGNIDPYYIDRYNADKKTENELKGLVDDLLSTKSGWMIWTRHNGSNVLLDGQTAQDAADALAGAIDYALTQGVQIVTVERGLAEYLDMH